MRVAPLVSGGKTLVIVLSGGKTVLAVVIVMILILVLAGLVGLERPDA